MMLFSFLWSNLSFAGKELLDQHQDELIPLTTVKPRNFSSAKDIETLHLFESGEIVAEDVQGKKTLIPNYQQPKELKEAIQGGYVDALLKNLNLYIRQSGDDLKLELMGGLKGGMYSGDNQGAYNPQTGQVVQKPTIVIRPQPQHVPKPQPVEKPDYNWSKKYNNGGPGGWVTDFNDPRYWEAYMEMQRYMKEKEEQERKQAEYEKYLQQEQAHQKYLKEKKAHDAEVKRQQNEQDKYLKQQAMLSDFVNNGWRGFPCAKSSLTPELYDLWKQKVGQSINAEFDYGLNLQGAVSLQSKKNGLALPVFKEDMENPACYLPHTYQPHTYQPQIHVETITHDNQESFIENALLPAIRQIHPTTASYKNYESLVGAPGSGYEKGMNPKVYWKQVWQDNDYNRYRVVETFLLPQLQQLFPESAVYKNYANFVNIKGTDKINPASGYKVGEELDGYYQRVWANHPDPNIQAKAKTLIGETFDPLNIKDIESLNFSNRTNHHEQLGEALIRGFGTGIDKLLCNTIGFCDANAGYGKLAMEVVKHGPQIINWADKSWKSVAVTLGLSAKTLYEKGLLDKGYMPHVKGIQDTILSTNPAQLDTRMKILETWGVEQSLKIFSTPQSEELATKLVTGTYEGADMSILTQDTGKIFEKNKEHIFRDAEGHLKEDTPDNRKILVDTIKGEYFSHTDEHGKDIYARTLENGKQVWLHVWNGDEIRDGGVNDIPRDPLNI
jgi:hypothetical protein